MMDAAFVFFLVMARTIQESVSSSRRSDHPLTIEVAMLEVEIVDALVGEARQRDLLILCFGNLRVYGGGLAG